MKRAMILFFVVEMQFYIMFHIYKQSIQITKSWRVDKLQKAREHKASSQAHEIL